MIDEREMAPERYLHRFGASPPLSLGVEEELLLVDWRNELTVACLNQARYSATRQLRATGTDRVWPPSNS